MSTRSIGSKAEEQAVKFLKQQGYQILCQNFTIRGGEVDIIARDKQELVFVEVKARFNHNFGLPEESITPWKLRALQKTALFYIQKIGWGNRPYRFDLVGIDYVQGESVKLLKNIL